MLEKVPFLVQIDIGAMVVLKSLTVGSGEQFAMIRGIQNDASVAYKQLGFTGASSASTSAAHGQGSSPIGRDHMNCVG